MPKPNGFVLWEGVSTYDPSQPIATVVTGLYRATANTKTGDLLQAWVLPSDRYIGEAQECGADRAVCGECPLRPAAREDLPSGMRPCYVKKWRGLGPVSRKLLRGEYPHYSPAHHDQALRWRGARLTAFGNSSAAPIESWEPLLSLVDFHTGYEHSWEDPRCDPRYRYLCMASVESEAQAERARALGWRTFRARAPWEAPAKGEVDCPAAKGTATSRPVQCKDCRLCSGMAGADGWAPLAHRPEARPPSASVTIASH